MSKGNGKVEDDFLGEGFERLDEEIVVKNPPKISWGKKYQMKTDAEKISYLEKLASSMNNAAFLIQNERNDLLELLSTKDRQVTIMAANLDANNNMIQQQVTKMNAEKQEYFKTIAALNTKVREYENGDNN